MGSLFHRVITVTIAVVFLFCSHIQLSDKVFPELHKHVRNEFGKFNKEFPFYHQTGWRPLAKNYRSMTGLVELFCSLCLLVGEFSWEKQFRNRNENISFFFLRTQGFLSTFCNIVLLMLMTNVIITLLKLNYPVEYTASSILISFLLAIRLVLESRANSSIRKQTRTEKKSQ